MKKLDFNDNWQVTRLTISKTDEELGNVDTSHLHPINKTVHLPHDAMIEERRLKSNATGAAMGYFTGGDYLYTKTFFLEESEQDQHFIIEFEGIFGHSTISVNGNRVTTNQHGYTGIRENITPYLEFGTDNQITVEVINSLVQNSRWYTGSGLYRPVYLYKAGKDHIALNGVQLTTPVVEENLATVEAFIRLQRYQERKKELFIRTILLDPFGQEVTRKEQPLTLMGQTIPKLKQRLFVSDPHIWSADTPNLYRCRVELLDGQEVIDWVEEEFGIRTLTMDPINGFRVNGQETLLRGGCIHHDHGIIGAAGFYRAEERRIALLKEAGFNAIRMSHNSASKALLEVCDRLGMYVIDETYDVWTIGKTQYDAHLHFEQTWEADLLDLVEKDYNHPSVIMYSIGNEIQDLHTSNGRKWNAILTERLHELDGTRFVTNAVNGLMATMAELPLVLTDLGLMSQEQLTEMLTGATEQSGDINDLMTSLMGAMNEIGRHPKVEEYLKEVFERLDVIGMNYMMGRYDVMAKLNPDRIFYGSETFPPDIDLLWKKVKVLPQAIGDFTWTAWDYIGESGIGIATYDGQRSFIKPYPAFLSYCSDIDLTGYRRPMSYYREIVFGLRTAPYIAVQLPQYYGQEVSYTPWGTPEALSSWTWPGFEAQPCLVEVYSDAPEVELFINGHSQGKQAAGEDKRFKAIFDVTYQPGDITAKAYYGDREEYFSLQTAQASLQLTLDSDRQVIGCHDLAYVTISLTDQNGVIDTSRQDQVKVTVSGSGQLQGFGTGNPVSQENFFDTTHSLFYGRALATIASTGTGEGSITVTVSAEGYAPKTLILDVQK